MGGCGRWLGLAIDLDAEAVMLNARHISLRLLPPCLFIRLCASLGFALEFPASACMLCWSWGFLSGRRSADLQFFFKSEDGVTIFIITVDTYMKHVVPLSLAVVIRLLVAFGREHVHRRQWNIGTVPCGIPGPSRMVLTTLISNVFSTFLRYILCSTRSTASSRW
jgi:hypothetical protein